MSLDTLCLKRRALLIVEDIVGARTVSMVCCVAGSQPCLAKWLCTVIWLKNLVCGGSVHCLCGCPEVFRRIPGGVRYIYMLGCAMMLGTVSWCHAK